ncbi:MAG: hypothetical protein LBI69_04450 [Puniceicoccales bacterium]|jgi:xanthosine utilization system XapX-like protein|nr:hypothetical protein [Puniceicoccales bacterium]
MSKSTSETPSLKSGDLKKRAKNCKKSLKKCVTNIESGFKNFLSETKISWAIILGKSNQRADQTIWQDMKKMLINSVKPTVCTVFGLIGILISSKLIPIVPELIAFVILAPLGKAAFVAEQRSENSTTSKNSKIRKRASELFDEIYVMPTNLTNIAKAEKEVTFGNALSMFAEFLSMDENVREDTIEEEIVKINFQSKVKNMLGEDEFGEFKTEYALVIREIIRTLDNSDAPSEEV